ncbi:hypothetical protein QYF61_009620 [Mycteria americana]|uniref:Uncharacterized protein n=1 Tax=Mycteria americana TaxID=33587 RepID=A0AAN7RXA7_MYCAM|nr:hypothetical protein QYF61_009620 [Mycteria americana]
MHWYRLGVNWQESSFAERTCWSNWIERLHQKESRQQVKGSDYRPHLEFKIPSTSKILTNWSEPQWRVTEMIRGLEHMAY